MRCSTNISPGVVEPEARAAYIAFKPRQETDMATANQRSPIRDRAPQGTKMPVEELIKDAIVESDGKLSVIKVSDKDDRRRLRDDLAVS